MSLFVRLVGERISFKKTQGEFGISLVDLLIHKWLQ